MDSSSTDGGIRLDVPAPQAAGCDKVDFLFVVDNSLSMGAHQDSLVASIPAFLATIEDVVEVGDYHIMVVDSDAWAINTVGGDPISCGPEPECCYALCNDLAFIPIDPLPESCGGTPCAQVEEPAGCDFTLGAGRQIGSDGASCELDGGAGFMTDQQTGLDDAFSCAALVGVDGHGDERVMAAMVDAVGGQAEAGDCNDGFLRQDALLVVTVITDRDDGYSEGSPQAWHDALVTAKDGREEAVVVLGLIPSEVEEQPYALREFVDGFEHGVQGDVSDASYDSFFQEAVSLVDLGCENFEPVG